MLEAFHLQVAHADLAPEDVVQMAWMGIAMAGDPVKDKQEHPILEPEQTLSQRQEFWETCPSQRLPVLRRLGIASTNA